VGEDRLAATSAGHLRAVGIKSCHRISLNFF
jgi:hypothetical protein